MTHNCIFKFSAALAISSTFAIAASWEDPPPATVIDAGEPVYAQPVRQTAQPQTRQARQTRQSAQQYQTRQIGQPSRQPVRSLTRQPSQQYQTRQVQPRQPQPQPRYVQPETEPRYVQPQPQPRYVEPEPEPRYVPPRDHAPYVEEPEIYEYSAREDMSGHYGDLFSQHLDAKRRPVYSYGGGYVAETEFGTYGVTDMAEANLEFRLFRFDYFLWGHLDAWVVGHGIYFIDNPGMEAIPDGLIDAGIDVGLWWRFVNGWSAEIRAMPGVFSDVTQPTFGIPITLNAYYAFNPQLSLKLGATYRSGWDIPVMPSAGIAWEPVDLFRVEAMLPKSKITLFPDHVLSFFGTFEWRNVTYALSDEEPSMPDKLTLDDMLITGGVALSPMGDYSIVGEYGMFISRELSADVEKDRAIDLSEESFIRVMLQGSF